MEGNDPQNDALLGRNKGLFISADKVIMSSGTERGLERVHGIFFPRAERNGGM